MLEPVLSVEGVHKRFGALAAVDGVSLTVLPGEIHALIGPNGAGKSTLIRIVAGEIVPDAGLVAFRGRDITRLGVAGRARMGLARTFQVSSVIPDFTVAQNLALTRVGASGRVFRFFGDVMRDGTTAETVARGAETAGLAGRLGVRAEALSHGERRRLEIAMALALEPRLLLLDEPMAGLGAEAAGSLGTRLATLKSKVPILLVEHDMDAVFRLSGRVSVLAEGRLIAAGTPDEIRRDAAVRRVYLGAGE
jgi:branched-chain amino acid transport system ATP-binding protein